MFADCQSFVAKSAGPKTPNLEFSGSIPILRKVYCYRVLDFFSRKHFCSRYDLEFQDFHVQHVAL